MAPHKRAAPVDSDDESEASPESSPHRRASVRYSPGLQSLSMNANT